MRLTLDGRSCAVASSALDAVVRAHLEALQALGMPRSQAIDVLVRLHEREVRRLVGERAELGRGR